MPPDLPGTIAHLEWIACESCANAKDYSECGCDDLEICVDSQRVVCRNYRKEEEG